MRPFRVYHNLSLGSFDDLREDWGLFVAKCVFGNEGKRQRDTAMLVWEKSDLSSSPSFA